MCHVIVIVIYWLFRGKKLLKLLMTIIVIDAISSTGPRDVHLGGVQFV